MRARTRSALVATLALLVIPCGASAQPPTTAAPTDEDLIAMGIDLRKQGRDAEALGSFERAYAQHASPRAAAQIALAHHALAHWLEAERGLVEAASSPPDALAAQPASARSTAGWITFASAGTLVLIGVGGVVTREWEAQIWNDDSRCLPPPGQPRSARCGTNRDIGSAAQAIAIGAFVGAGIAGAVSAVLLLGSPRSAAVPTTARVDCRTAGLGFSCGGAS
jgi:hypothetical protein